MRCRLFAEEFALKKCNAKLNASLEKWVNRSIGRLERFLADWECDNGYALPPKATPTGKKMAIVGAGPAGLTAAADLIKLGHEVTMFEALHVGGGVLVIRYSRIPCYPKPSCKTRCVHPETWALHLRLGNWLEESTLFQNLMKDGYNGVFIGSGAGLPQFTGCPGENFGGIYSANEFLIRVNLMKAFQFPDYDTPIRIRQTRRSHWWRKRCHGLRTEVACVLGRTYASLQAFACRMPARHEEIENAEEEGLVCKFLAAPVEFYGDEKGWVKSMKVIAMELTEPDAKGRRGVKEVPGSEFTMDVDTVIVAIGQTPNPIIQRTTDGLQSDPRHGTICVNEVGKTSLDGVYAGGDVATGAATVISAMGAGKRAAKAMHEYLTNKK